MIRTFSSIGLRNDELQKYVEALLDCVLAGGLNFFKGGSAVYFGMRRGFVAGTILGHNVDGG